MEPLWGQIPLLKRPDKNNPGDTPSTEGNLIFVSIIPYVNCILYFVVILPEVYSLFLYDSFLALIYNLESDKNIFSFLLV